MTILKTKPSDFRILHGGPGPIHTWADTYAAVANAGMFQTNSGQPVGALVASGTVVNRWPTTWPLFMIRHGHAQIYRANKWAAYWDLDRCTHAVSCAPLLAWDGHATDVAHEVVPAGVNPASSVGRTAIGIDAAGNVILAVEASATLAEMQQKLLAAGAVSAMNLDGGGSSILYRDGKLQLGMDIRKYPSAIALMTVIEEDKPVATPLQHYPITLDLLTAGKDHNRPGTPLNVQGVVMHDTENDEADAKANRDYFDTPGVKASAHLIADWNGIIGCIPWGPGQAEQAWHAGPTANSQYVGIELCTTKDPARFAASLERWCYAAARVLVAYDIETGPGLWSHKGVADRWHETNHTDPYPYLSKWGKRWQDVLDRVNEYMVFTRANPAPAPPAVDWPARVEQLQAHLADERAAREKAEAKLAQVREIVGGAK